MDNAETRGLGGHSELDVVRGRVAAASRELARQGLVIGTAGNVSQRSGDAVAITPTGGVLSDLTPEEIVVIDLDGNHLAGELAPTSEVALHLGIYDRYDAGAVVHTHAPMATALACVLEELPLVHYTMLALGGPVRVAPYRTFGTPELAEVTLEALRDRSAALMANHGAIVHGPDVETAAQSALLLEWAAGVYWHAAAVGAPRTLDEEESQAVIAAVVERGYGETRRRQA